VDGIDLDPESIETATKNTAGLEDRVMFTCGSAADLDGGQRYDLITCSKRCTTCRTQSRSCARRDTRSHLVVPF
jgi:hypothetical protein